MAKLILLVGLPASGKSTKAKELLANGNTVRINKDLLRTMLHFDKWSGPNEGKTHVAAKELAASFLKTGKANVVIDDTNLNPGTLESWKSLATETDAKLEIIRMDTSVEECVKRDSAREKKVGEHVIRNMALRYGLVEKPSKGYVLCDVDGTIADGTHRHHFIQKTPKDWRGFFSQQHLDAVRLGTLDILFNLYIEGYTIIFVSARPEDYRKVTNDWLMENVYFKVQYYSLIMRKAGDRRDDDIVKKELLDMYFPDKSLIHKVVDDRPRVISMWRKEGLDVIDVGMGIDF